MRLLLILSSLLIATSSFAQQSEAEVVKKLATNFGNAWLKGDIQTLDHLLAREYTHTDVTGRVLNRSEWLTDAANVEKWARSSETKGTPTIGFYGMEVKLLGDAAVVTGGNVIQPAGSAPPLKLRFTQVWIKEDGQWKRRYFQATPIQKQE